MNQFFFTCTILAIVTFAGENFVQTLQVLSNKTRPTGAEEMLHLKCFSTFYAAVTEL